MYGVDLYHDHISDIPYLIGIRPVEWNYSRALDFFHYKIKNDVMRYKGQVASYDPDTNIGRYLTTNHKFSSIEEWLIWLALDNDIRPDFEDTVFYDKNSYTMYIGKTVDLHTNEILWDNTTNVIETIKNKLRSKSS